MRLYYADLDMDAGGGVHYTARRIVRASDPDAATGEALRVERLRQDGSACPHGVGSVLRVRAIRTGPGDAVERTGGRI